MDFGGNFGRGEFEITGEPNKQFVLTTPEEVEFKSDSGDIFRVTNFQWYPSNKGLLRPDGKATVFLGATLHLRPGTGSGKGKTTMDFFVDYLP